MMVKRKKYFFTLWNVRFSSFNKNTDLLSSLSSSSSGAAPPTAGVLAKLTLIASMRWSHNQISPQNHQHQHKHCHHHCCHHHPQENFKIKNFLDRHFAALTAVPICAREQARFSWLPQCGKPHSYSIIHNHIITMNETRCPAGRTTASKEDDGQRGEW